MKNLLKQIENSEANNPQFQAAIEEINKLQDLLDKIKIAAYRTDFSYLADDGVTTVKVKRKDIDKWRAAEIQNLTLFNYL